LPLLVYLLAGLLKKFSTNFNVTNNKRLDFRSDPYHDTDPEILKGNFYHRQIGQVEEFSGIS